MPHCDTQYIVFNTLVNTTSVVSALLCMLTVYRIVKIQFYSENPMQTLIFYVYLIFYCSSIFIPVFAIATDISNCSYDDESAHNHTMHILFGLETLFFVVSWIMFNVVLFARLYFTFKDTVYQMSRKCTKCTILTLSAILLIYIPSFAIFMAVGLSLITIALYTLGFLCLMIFSPFLVFRFVYKLFDMNLTSLVNSLGDVPDTTAPNTQLKYYNSAPTMKVLTKGDRVRSISIPSMNPVPSLTNTKTNSNANVIVLRRRGTIDELCALQIKLMTKYTLLAMLSVVSSFAVFMICVIWIVSGFSLGKALFGLRIGHVIGIALAFHSLFDVICVTFAFKIFEKHYRVLCSCCDKKLKICCVNLVDKHYQSKTDAEKSDLRSQMSERSDLLAHISERMSLRE